MAWLGVLGMHYRTDTAIDPAGCSMNGLCSCLLVVIPGEDPGSSVEHCLLQRPVVHFGSQLKAGMTKNSNFTVPNSSGVVAWHGGSKEQLLDHPQCRAKGQRYPVFVIRCPLFVIPGEDPGSSVEQCLLQRPAVNSGSRLKAGMTKKIQTSPC